MNRIALLAAGCAVLALAACDHPDAARQRQASAVKVISKLDCPETQGHLKRVGAAADGLSCDYAADGVEVTLKLVKLEGGDAAKALGPIEADLRTLMPAPRPTEADAAAKAESDGEEDVNINLPGVSIKTTGGSANVSVGGADGPRINADDDGAEIRIQRNVTVDGKKVERAVHRRRHRDDSVYSRFILASDKPTAGWAVVGYEARGPQGGPLVVATVKAKRGKHGDDDTFSDIDDLVRHNVGGRRNHGITIGAD
ncbi:MAG: hypothetical protein Q7U20_11285 [Caulobacter sp.]|nr:hypothetical protein [Caulobacter sp.]